MLPAMDLAGEAQGASGGDVLRIGVLEIRPEEGLALAGGRALRLSVREFGLLVELARSEGRIVRREDLYEHVWGASLRHGDRTVDVYIRKLRVKLEHALPEWHFIHTHVGFGYRFAPERSPGFHTDATAR
jgi:DNA-binding response OmpR family regulator